MLYRNYLKRIIDFIFSFLALIILTPLLVLIAILIKIDSKGPILFKQRRFGINNSLFQIYKFRTMRIDTPKDTPTHLLEDPKKWITPLGNFLRKSSLDELPQLLNILKGEMAIVGPRPALWNQTDLIELRTQNGSSSIRPGLTGWAQVNGRDELNIDLKANFDLDYYKKIKFINDVYIVFLTIYIVLNKNGFAEGKNRKNDNSTNFGEIK